MRISDWSSDVCSSDLGLGVAPEIAAGHRNDMHFIPRDELRKVLAQLVAGVGGNMVELVHRDQPIIEGGDAEFLHREAEGGMGADQPLVVALQKRADAVDIAAVLSRRVEEVLFGGDGQILPKAVLPHWRVGEAPPT